MISGEDMGDSLVEDISRLRHVLRLNSLEGSVDEDLLLSLLENHAANSQRFRTVLSQLEEILGFNIQDGTQILKWDDLKKQQVPSGETTTTSFQVNNSNMIINAAVEGVQRQLGVSVLPHLAPIQNTQSAHAVQSGTPKLLVISEQQASVNGARKTKETKRKAQDASAPGPSGVSKIRKVAKTGGLVSQQLNDVALQQAHKSQSPDGLQIKNEPKNESNIEKMMVAQSLFQNILTILPNIHPIYAAFKAAELVIAEDPIIQTNMFLEGILWAKSQTLVTLQETWNPPAISNPDQLHFFLSIRNRFIDSKVEFLLSSLPDVDPEFLQKTILEFSGNDAKIQRFIAQVLDGTLQVPMRAGASQKKQLCKLVENFFTVEQFLEMYDDPLNHFKNDSRVTDSKYREQAFTQLKSDFRFASVYIIRKTFRENNFHYTPSYFVLESSKKIDSRKTKRPDSECYGNKAADPFLLQEIAFVRLRENIETYLKNKKKMRAEAVEAAKSNNTLQDCPICCEDELVEMDLIRCPQGHGTCRSCVRRQSEELIGQMKNHVQCLTPNCPAEYTLKDLKAALTKSSFLHLEKRRQAEEILAAGIEGLESCPFCEYCEVPPEKATIFRCRKPDCMKVSCRKCREPDHLPLRCEENAMKQKLANYVESKMTEALVRECPTCKKKFVKADGCNKMVCVCGTILCYICRKQIKDYHHFQNNNLPPDQQPNQKGKGPKLCPLYSNTEKMHEEEVAKSAAQAKAELASKNPNVRVDLVLQDKKRDV